MNLIVCILLSTSLMVHSEFQNDSLKSTIHDQNINKIQESYTPLKVPSLTGCKLQFKDSDHGKNIYKVIFDKGIFFDVEESELNNSSKETLTKFIDFMVKNTTLVIDITGHTDITGTFEVNKGLSTTRAKNVANYLISKNVPTNQINEVVGKNFSEPVESNFTESGRAANRRVDIYLKLPAAVHNANANQTDSLNIKHQNPTLKKLVENVVKHTSKTNDAELEIDGLIVDDTKTKSGKDFYDMFYSLWIPPSSARNYSITISEKPYRLNYTLIEVSINENIVYQSVLQPRQDIVESQSNEAISYSQDYLQNYEEIMNMMNGEDLKGSGIF